MKLLTINCHSWQEENQLEKISHLAKVIKENGYDVIALQEVSQLKQGSSKKINSSNYIIKLLEQLEILKCVEYEYIWEISHIGYDIYEEGIGILTKHKVVKKEGFYISNSNDIEFWKSRKIVKATIDYNGENVDIYSCHLGWWKDDEEPFNNQLDKLIEHIDNDKLSFLMGDFNNSATVEKEGYEYIISKGLKDTYESAQLKDEGYTVEGKIAGWDKNCEKLRVDYIFTNKEIKVEESKVIFNGKNKDIISDHFGVEIRA